MRQIALILTITLSTVLYSTSVNAIDRKAAERLKGTTVQIRQHLDMCGTPSFKMFRRTTRECDVRKEGTSIYVNSAADWKSDYFFSGQSLKIVAVDYKTKEDEIRLRVEVPSGTSQTEFRLHSISNFEEMFRALFFTDGEDQKAYASEVDQLLIQSKIDGPLESSHLTASDKIELLHELKSLTDSGKPEFKLKGSKVYGVVRPQIDDMDVYNTIRVNKNQRLASTISKAMTATKLSISESSKRSTCLEGYVLMWRVFYGNAPDYLDKTPDAIEMTLSKVDFREYVNGSLSVFELIQKSILMVNGEKYTLTSFEPIS